MILLEYHIEQDCLHFTEIECEHQYTYKNPFNWRTIAFYKTWANAMHEANKLEELPEVKRKIILSNFHLN